MPTRKTVQPVWAKVMCAPGSFGSLPRLGSLGPLVTLSSFCRPCSLTQASTYSQVLICKGWTRTRLRSNNGARATQSQPTASRRRLGRSG